MARKKAEESPKEEGAPRAVEGVVARSISTEMRESYLDYAMTVITARALPDVRDGLKPVHRRILYAMHEAGLTVSAKTRKSATVVGDVIGKYHPHGDVAVYDAMVKMAQDFTMRYPLIIGQGNFGSIDGDGAAAYRYTEAKMARLASELLRDIDKETVEFRANYDNTKKEPSVMPAAIPNLLLNGTLGIAVGMASNIPPHNLREVCEAAIHLIENPDAATEDLLQFVKGPDFPTGCVAFNQRDIAHAYTTGRGPVVVRGVAEIVEGKSRDYQIIITSIPFRVVKADLLTKIADLVHQKKLEGIRDIRDESTKDIRVVVELKNNANPQTVLNYLYKHTQLEDTFHYNVVTLVDGVPQTLSLKALLEYFVAFRREVVTKRTKFDLARAEAREHILLGLKKALDHIDEIIKLIKKSKDVNDARLGLMKTFKFSELQANAILEMRLQKLAGLERKKIEDELKEVQVLIAELSALLKSEKKLMDLIKKEIREVIEKYGDDRRTKIVKHEVKSLSAEDLVADEESALVLTQGGYVKRTNPEEFRRQKRGGVGVIDLDTKEEDFVTTILTTSTHSDLLFFTNVGKAYQIKMYEIPEGRRSTKGKAIVNFLPLTGDESVYSVLPMRKDQKKGEQSLVMITKDGIVKKTDATAFHDVRRSGLIAIKLQKGDALVAALIVEKGDELQLVSSRGQSVRFKESDVRAMGRTAGGVRAMKLSKNDAIVGADIISKSQKDLEVLVVSRGGFGKTTPVSEYKTQKRGGSGIKTMNVTDKTGPVIAARVISKEEGVGEDEIVVISKKGQVIRTALAQIPSLSRATQGVRIMRLRAGDAIAAFVCL